MTDTPRVALYARVSTSDKGQDTENQLTQLRQYAATRGWKIAGEYVDEASGKTAARVRFRALFTDASRGLIDIVLVWALDRFTREGVAETFEHIKRLRGHGVDFVSYTEEHFRTTGAAGELMLAIAAWIAEQERKRIVERTMAGLDRARREGKQLGRPRVIFNRERVREMRAAGSSIRAIATELGLSVTTVARTISTS